jgi:4a-hydroxytetrahydrobiopterin dehydratase
MTQWQNLSCTSQPGGAEPIAGAQARDIMSEFKEWELDEAQPEIRRAFKFKNYYETMAFVNAVAWIANQEDHHPDMEVSYNRCVVHFSTHSVKGLSNFDFICAAKVDALLSNSE